MNTSTKIYSFLGKFIFFWGFVQVILIGLAYFQAATPEIHAFSGLLLEICALVMLVTAITGKLGGRQIGKGGFERADVRPAHAVQGGHRDGSTPA